MTYLKACDVGKDEEDANANRPRKRSFDCENSRNADGLECQMLLEDGSFKVHALETAAIKPDAKNQFISAGVVSGIATVSIGTVLGFSAILLPQLDSEMTLTSDEASWIASLSNIGQLFGAIGTGILAGKFGRRPTMMLLCFPLLAGWVTMGLSQGQVWMFYLGRILQGLGVMSSVTQVYLVEIADTDHRGMFGASGALSVSVGITLTYCLGALFPWRVVCIICGSIPILVFVCMYFLPETPPWLVLHNKKEEAEKSLQWLRGSHYDISGELEALAAAQGKGVQNTSLLETLKTFKYPGAYKPFMILLFVFFFQQLSGSYAVIFYAVTLFKDIGVSTNPYIPAIVTGFIRLLGTLIGTALIKRYGRKPLMTISAILMGVFMASLAVTVFYKEKFYNENCLETKPNATLPDHCVGDRMLSMKEEAKLAKMQLFYDIYPAVSVILYMLVFGAGVGTIPWLLLGELCPSKVKGIASGITVFMAFITIFAVVKVFPYALLYLKPHGTYGFFAVVSILMAVFTVLFVPETRGKSLSEIQTMFGELGEGKVELATVSGSMEKGE